MTILTPDMAATTEVDILGESLRFHLAVAEATRRDLGPDADDLVERARVALEEYDHTGPKIKIGYMPASKKTEIEHRHLCLMRGKDIDNLDASTMDELTDICRECARWGVRGHTLEIPFDTFPSEYRGRKYELAGPAVLDVYERNGWLHLLRTAVIRYNSLAEEKKTASSSNAGTDRPISTAPSARPSPP